MAKFEAARRGAQQSQERRELEQTDRRARMVSCVAAVRGNVGEVANALGALPSELRDLGAIQDVEVMNNFESFDPSTGNDDNILIANVIAQDASGAQFVLRMRLEWDFELESPQQPLRLWITLRDNTTSPERQQEIEFRFDSAGAIIGLDGEVVLPATVVAAFESIIDDEAL